MTIPIILAILAIVAAFSVPFINHSLTSRRERAAKRSAAAAAFLSAINEDAMAAPSLAIYVYQNLTINIAAIDAFRQHIAKKDLGKYDKAKEQYYAAVEPFRDVGPAGSLAVDLSPNAVAKRQAIIDAIIQLRSFAE